MLQLGTQPGPSNNYKAGTPPKTPNRNPTLKTKKTPVIRKRIEYFEKKKTDCESDKSKPYSQHQQANRAGSIICEPPQPATGLVGIPCGDQNNGGSHFEAKKSQM